MKILGISAYFHDSSAAVVVDGKVIAAAQEERFSRKKHDNSFPLLACEYCLNEAKIKISEIDKVVFFEKPFLKFERIIETAINTAPKGLNFFVNSMPIWLYERLNMKSLLKKELSKLGEFCCDINFVEHHLSHAALAFYTSSYDDAIILVVDAVGEWATTSIYKGTGSELCLIKEQHFPNSIGLFYSTLTQYLGFKVNSDEYKVMGLAPYGKRNSPETISFLKSIKDNMISLNDDGSVEMNMKYFDYSHKFRMSNNKEIAKIIGIPHREPAERIEQSHCNLALALQIVLEEWIINLCKKLKEEYQTSNLCLCGGVALNCAMNGTLREMGLFNSIFVPFSPGDGGSSIGSALAVSRVSNEPIKINDDPYLGPCYSNEEVKHVLDEAKIPYNYIDNLDSLCSNVSHLLSEGKIVGWFQGKMEFGPRALGNRSILADARFIDMKHRLNKSIKFREGFRPFAPVVLEEYVNEYFVDTISSPYMMFTTKFKKDFCSDVPQDIILEDAINYKMSFVPAVTHIDKTARIQTVNKTSNKRLYKLLTIYNNNTGCPLLVNTSFNVMGEPIVCSPYDAIKTFLKSGMDVLVINDFFTSVPLRDC